MPILHLSQLIGVAAGFSDSELKFKRHVVPVTPVDRKALGLTARLGRHRAGGRRRGLPRLGLVRGGLGAPPRPRRRAAGAARRARRAADRPPVGLPPRCAVARRDGACGRAVEWARERDPDLVCVTGDLVSRPRGEPSWRLLERLPRCYAILGNHDIGAKRDPFSKTVELTALDPATLLLDEGRMLDVRGRACLARGPRSRVARH